MSNSTDVKQLPPGPGGLPVIGNLRRMQKQGILTFYQDLWKEFGDVVRVNMGPMNIYQFIRPEHIQTILVKRSDKYVKGLSHEKLRVALGSGILTAEGELWRRQRKLMAPTYTRKGVEQFAEIMNKETQKMLSRWKLISPVETLSINKEMMRLAMSVISQSMFTIDVGEDFKDAGDALTFILEFANKRTMSLIDPPMFIPTPMNRKIKSSIDTIDKFLYNIIDERRNSPPGDDLLSILMTAVDEESGNVMDDKQLRDEVLITFFAGHETTAQLLTWAWYLLAKHPGVEECFHQELDQVLAGRSPEIGDVPNLVYTRMIIDETLRLFSPVAMTARDALVDDVVDGYFVPKGSVVTITPYITHRHPDYWEKPNEFYPEHFSQEKVDQRPRYAYIPFGAGPRICLGMHFALLEAALVLGDVGQRYKFKLESDQDVNPVWSGTLRPEVDIFMTLSPRQGSN